MTSGHNVEIDGSTGEGVCYRRALEHLAGRLDDPGKEYGGARGSGLAGAAFDAVLRHRVASNLPTIITTNLNLTDLQEQIGPRTTDRLKAYKTIHVDGPNLRDREARGG